MALPFAAQIRAPHKAAGPAERMFVALVPDAATRGALSTCAARFSAAGRAIAPANIHMTLVFLGSVPAARRTVAARCLRQARIEAFDLRLDQLGHFAGSAILWAGMQSPPPALMTAQRRLAAGLRSAGFALEARRFRPHVSLMRDCHNLDAGVVAGPIAIDWPAREIALMRSHPARGGSRYEVIESVLLGHVANGQG